MEAAEVLRVAGALQRQGLTGAEGVERAEAALIALYRVADKRLRAQIRRELLRGAIGTAAYHQRVLNSIQVELRRLKARTRPLSIAAVIAGYLQGLRISQRLPRSAAPAEVIGGEFQGVHVQAISRIAESLVLDLDRTIDTVGRSVDDTFRRVAVREVGIGFATGGAKREVSKAIQAELERQGLAAFVDKRGRRWSLRNYAEMVALTTTREAVTEAMVRDLTNRGRDLIKVSQHADSCPICKPFEGKVYSLSGADNEFPRATQLPPFHPRCRHSIGPAPQTFARRERALGLVN